MKKNELCCDDYMLISKALEYYTEKCGFNYLESDWVVCKEANDFTMPQHLIPTIIHGDGYFIASAEQSFIARYLEGGLEHNISYVLCSPCIRPDFGKSEYHNSQFMKVELCTLLYDYSSVMTYVRYFVNTAIKFLSTCTDKQIQINHISDTQIDLEIDGVEIGSYGFRKLLRNDYIVYGTGLAVPRFRKLM